LALGVCLVTAASSAKDIVPVPDKIPCAVADLQDSQIPDRVHLSGMIGTRIHNSAGNRLQAIDADRLLEGYRKRPGRQTWDGEHVGKWLHAATLAWVNTGDPRLREKMDYVVRKLVKCQLDDGYLGTYLPKDRWIEWDVWAHKYNLLGLITYMRYTGDMTALPTCRRMADLLCRDFGDQPGQRDLNKAGEHLGMAPGSVLEPMVLLYRLTGEPRYADFCRYILRAWELPSGPHIVSRLLAGQGVNKVGNGKAYEMLSCINGLVEWYRTTGDRQYLQAAVNAWNDITSKRNYITGSVSVQDFFGDDHWLPNPEGGYHAPGAGGSENCDTITWLQLNAQFLRLTGECRYAEQIERVLYNQVLGAQHPDGRTWGPLVSLEGAKHYTQDSCNCCLSSGPRGIALTPTFAITTDANGIVVNLYDAAEANLQLHDGTAVRLAVTTQYPMEGTIRFAVEPAGDHKFALKCRIPDWSARFAFTVNGTAVDAQKTSDGYLSLERVWKKGDKAELHLAVEPRVVLGEHTNKGKAAILFGPLVLAADQALLDGKTADLTTIGLASSDPVVLGVTAEPAPAEFRTWPAARVFRIHAASQKENDISAPPVDIRLIPFADAGATAKNYKVWLPLIGK
jgi:DUF1680 family protein